MQVRYFEKNGKTWADFKINDVRKRMNTGVTWGNQKAAELAMPGVIARAMKEMDEAANAPAGKKDTVKVEKKPSSGFTLKSSYDYAMKNREQWMQSKDKKSIRTVFEAIIASHPDLSEDTDMATFTRDFVLDLRAKWMEEPGKRKGTTLSASTINHRLSMLAVLLEQCKLAPHTVKHLSTKGNERTRRITDEEVRRGQSWLLANANNYSGAADFCDLITAGLGLAARQGELLDVLWTNVNLIGDMPTVKFDDTKNGTSRTVPLPASVVTLLERRKHVKPGPFGNLNTDRCTKLWNLMKAGIGIPEDDEEFVFHGLRHEGLSRLGDGDTNAFTIQAIAGHANVTTTQRYVHSSTAAMARAMGVSKPSARPQEETKSFPFPGQSAISNGC